MRVTGLHEPLELHYLSRGERGRLQIDRPGSESPPFDAIFAGDHVFVLDHAKRRYRERTLGDVPKNRETSDVHVERTRDQREVNGLLCYPWRLSSGEQTIEACVRALPGTFDTDKLESLSGFDIPAWVEKVIADSYLPISARVTQAGRELYKLELLQYSPDEVPDNELAVPANYQKS
jgi:hypothetical protein